MPIIVVCGTKCKKLEGMGKLHAFFVSNGAINVKLLENDRVKPITHPAELEKISILISCRLFVGNSFF